MQVLIKIFLDIVLIALIFYSKVTPYRDQLTIDYKNAYLFIDKIISPLSSRLNKFSKPISIGSGISLDVSHSILMVVLIILINIL